MIAVHCVVLAALCGIYRGSLLSLEPAKKSGQLSIPYLIAHHHLACLSRDSTLTIVMRAQLVALRRLAVPSRRFFASPAAPKLSTNVISTLESRGFIADLTQ